MIVGAWLAQATKKLTDVGIGTARLDALILLEDLLKKDRGWLLAHQEMELKPVQAKKLDSLMARRAQHEPLAYIRGFTEFYGRRFAVNKDVLEPRPESETMIDLLKKLPAPKVIIDIGTGSGALAIAAKLEIPKAEVLASDIDPKCLKVARQNAKTYKVKIDFFKGDLLSPIPSTPSPILLANLPYVPTSYQINEAAAMEPRLAIFGGGDGLDVYRRFFAQLAALKQKPAFVLTEALPPQHKKLAAIAKTQDFKLHKSQDFIQVLESTG